MKSIKPMRDMRMAHSGHEAAVRLARGRRRNARADDAKPLTAHVSAIEARLKQVEDEVARAETGDVSPSGLIATEILAALRDACAPISFDRLAKTVDVPVERVAEGLARQGLVTISVYKRDSRGHPVRSITLRTP